MTSNNDRELNGIGMSGGFVHLHLHSQYSLLESSITFEDLLSKAKEYQMPAVAVTDHGNMFGAIEFYNDAQKSASCRGGSKLSSPSWRAAVPKRVG